jgi:hypothetical protein
MPAGSMADLGLYYYDRFGNRELLHRDPELCSTTPVPLAVRPSPPVRAEPSKGERKEPVGRFLITDIYQGLPGVPHGAAKRLRLVAVPPKVQPSWGVPALGLTSYDPGKFVIGTVPIEEDGSVYCVAPSGVNLFFQVLGEDGRAIQTMRSATYLQPGELQSCIGCHEPRNQAPSGDWPNSARRAPSRIRPDVEGSWPYRFDRLMKPMLDRLAAANDPKLARLGVTSEKAWELVDGRGAGQYFIPIPGVPLIWRTLADYGEKGLSLRDLLREQDVAAASPVGRCMATISPIWGLFTAPEGLPLTADERARLALWLDTYAQIQGHFSPAQEIEITDLRQRWIGILENERNSLSP